MCNVANYKNMFYDDNVGKLVYVKLSSEDLIVQQEETGGESQAVELDIKNGYVGGKGYNTPAMISAPLIYELTNSRGVMPDDVAELIATEPRVGNHITGAFQVLFNNFIYTCIIAGEHRRQGYTRHRYQISSGAIVNYSRDSRGLNIKHVLLGESGSIFESTASYSVLSNIYSGGDTCHWGLTEVNNWRINAGKSEAHPDTLAKSYELFKAGIGNNDLTACNMGVSMDNEEVIAILEEFEREYVDNIPHRGMKRNMKAYMMAFLQELRRMDYDETHRFNANQLATILEKTPNFYIEDYL